MVALHPEGVDRNSAIMSRKTTGIVVALHPEGVDRNHRLPKVARVVLVALHPEGVDRNPMGVDAGYVARLSPSTRRAWIEIARCWFGGLWRFVALHPEGVDRNACSISIS